MSKGAYLIAAHYRLPVITMASAGSHSKLPTCIRYTYQTPVTVESAYNFRVTPEGSDHKPGAIRTEMESLGQPQKPPLVTEVTS